MFDNLNETEFIQKNKERNIKWNKLNKSNKNSIIEIDSTKNFFIKSIKMANIDFEQIETKNNSELILSNEYTVWRELLLIKKINKYHTDNNSKLYVHLYTSFIRMYDDEPYLSMIFKYYPFTLEEILKYYPTHNFHMEILLQLFIQFYYFDKLGIHHNDFHWNNIMSQKYKNIYINFTHNNHNYKWKCNFIFIIIDYGFTQIDTTKSNFPEFKNFFLQIPFISLPFNLKNINNYDTFFQKILSHFPSNS